MIKDIGLPLLLVMNYVTLIYYKEDIEYLAVPFEMTRHGVTADLTLRTLGGELWFFIEEEYLPFWCDNEKIY